MPSLFINTNRAFRKPLWQNKVKAPGITYRAITALTPPQRLFVGYTLAVLVDLTVLNLFEEFWDYVTIKSFTVSLAAAILLQVLLKLSIAAEHRLANYFKGKEGLAPKIYRGLSTYIILVGSKIIMLEAINILFGDKVSFSGPLNGVVAFFAVIFVILIAEITVSKIYFALEDKPLRMKKSPPTDCSIGGDLLCEGYY